MAINKVYLQDLVPSPKPLTNTLVLRLEIKDKISLLDGVPRYQNYMFRDENGTKRCACSFGKYAAFFNTILEQGEVYHISKIIVKQVLQQYELYPHENQMYFAAVTEVTKQPAEGSQADFTAQYLPLAEVQEMVDKDIFDIAVVVIRVDPQRFVRSKRTGLYIDLCDLFITDDSTDNIVPLTAWKDLAHQCQGIRDWETDSCVVVFNSVRALKYEFHSGSMQTLLHLLREIKFLEGRTIKEEIPTLTLAEAVTHKPADVALGDMIRIHANVTAFANNGPQTKFSCPSCGNTPPGKAVAGKECDSCPHKPLCTIKMYMPFIGVDGKTRRDFLAKTKTAEKILGISAEDLHNMKPQEHTEFLQATTTRLAKDKTLLVLTPSSVQLAYKIVDWELRYAEAT